MANEESPAEVAYRLRNEQRCAELARELDAKLKPDGLAFCLVVATIDDEHQTSSRRYSNTSYVSTCRREDAARLLTELVDKWQTEGNATEPTARTCTMIREAVFLIRDHELGKVMTGARHRVREVIEATSPADRAKKALLLACEALAIVDIEMRRAAPRRGS
jgi:hypothetical protein